MTFDNALWMLTALAAVVVLLTRMRLAVDEQAGNAQISRGALNAHTVVGVVVLVVWIYYLTSPSVVVGYVAVGLWWLLALIGLLILARWLPASGRHAADSTDDNWAQGPSLSILGHVGMVMGVAVFTFAVVADKVT